MNRRPIIVVAGVIVLITVVILIISLVSINDDFKLVNSSPVNKERGFSPNSKIIFEFNRNLLVDNKTIGFKSSPYEFEADIEISNNIVTISPIGILRQNENYSFILANVVSVDGEYIESVEINFTTSLDNSDKGKFIRTLPIISDAYSLEYIYSKDYFIFEHNYKSRETAKKTVEFIFNDNNLNAENENIRLVNSEGDGGGTPPPPSRGDSRDFLPEGEEGPQ